MDDVLLRPGTEADLTAVAEVYLAARAAAVPAMPPIVHTPAEVRDFVGSWQLGPAHREVWVAAVDGSPVAFADLTSDWLAALYVHPSYVRQGLGSDLLDLVKACRPGGFSLWVFESNRPARTFYARHGLVELERTDGSANEERSPDIRMAWLGADPVGFLRRQIDEVDTELGDLLARRVALTRSVQGVKDHHGRDPEREAEVVERVAARVPALDAAAVAAIVDAIITASLP